MFTNTECGTLFASIFLFPSPLCRSLKPVLTSGYVVVDPRYKGKGIASEIAKYIDIFSIQNGYHGHISRISVHARHLVPWIRQGREPLGIIPKSLYVEKLGWMPDMIMYDDYSSHRSSNNGFHIETETTSGVSICHDERDNDSQKLLNFRSCGIDQKIFSTFDIAPTKNRNPDLLEVVYSKTNNSGETINLCKGVALQDQQVQDLFRKAATKGEGFAIDELDEQRNFRCKLIRKPEVLVATKEPETEVIGVLVYGSPALCRTPGQTTTAYIIVSEPERGKGNGHILFDCYNNIVKNQNNISTVLFDVFKTNQKTITWLISRGFDVSGTIKCSGFIVGTGNTDIVILHKNVNATNWPQVLK